jgi:general secretion pathway protein H
VTRGYTLIEVVAVLLVLALAAGLVAPSVGRSVDAFRTRAEVAGVASFLRAARAQAITREAPCEVRVDPDARALVLHTSENGRVTKPVSAALRIVAEAAPAGTIIFYPHGRSSGGQLRIEAPGPSVYVVTVDALTGRVATRRRES